MRFPSATSPRLELSTGSPTRYCVVNSSEGNGWYNCTWDSSSQLRINWNITMNVNKSYYAPNSTMEGNAFHLGTAPLVSSPNVSPSPGGWGERFAFTVYFADADNDQNNVSLWFSTDNSTWQIGNSTAVSSSGTTITFYKYFSCSDIGTLYYKFNTTDPFNYTSETPSGAFNITGDNVTAAIISPSGSVSMLNDTTTLIFSMYDSVNGSYLGGIGGLVWVAENGQDYTKLLNCTSNSSGQCNVSYNPNASTSSLGTQYWKAGSNSSSSCHAKTNSSNQSITVTNPMTTTAISPHAMINGTGVSLFASHSAASLWLWANVTLPDSSWQMVSLTNGSNTTFASTGQTGRYNVTFLANDSARERLINDTAYFESFQPIVFNATIVAYNNSGVNSSFTFYYANESLSSNVSANGNFSGQIVKSVIDIFSVCARSTKRCRAASSNAISRSCCRWNDSIKTSICRSSATTSCL